MYGTALIIWIAFLLIAFFYVSRARNPRTPLFAAWLLFVSLFSVIAFLVFAVGTWAMHAAGIVAALSHPLWAGVFLTIVFVPAFLVARWQLGKPPRQRMPGEPDRIINGERSERDGNPPAA